MNNKMKKKILERGSMLLREGTRNFATNYPELLKTDFKKGDIPRCLYYEDGEKNNRDGCVIVGLNPGKPRDPEKAHYRNNKKKLAEGNYEPVLGWWQEEGPKRNQGSKGRYYEQARGLARGLGRKGPIIWTELVKWGFHEKKGKFRMQTIRDHVRSFLKEEIKIAPRSWPLIALGRRAFEVLAFVFPDRKIIGVPHPTGRYAKKKFEDLNRNRNRNNEIAKAKKLLSKKTGKHAFPIAITIGFRD
jgi:hypothetical protein